MTDEIGRATRGALAGLAATGPMTVAFETASHLRLLDELPPVRIIEHLLPGLSPQATRAAATIAHAAYGAAAGAVLAAVTSHGPLRRSTTVGYALVLWLLSYEGWVPIAGVLPPVHRDRRAHAASIAISHVVFGLALRIPRA